jgi:RNA polymerase sigma-70 factor (ECF subfamily)
MGVEREALDDICQDVFLQAFRYLPNFRGECSFQTWLYRICSSEARRTRHRQSIARALSSWLRPADEIPQTALEMSTNHALDLVHRVLKELKESERLVFVLYELEGLPGRQIAEIVDCPEATVWRRLHYARKSFRKHIEENGVPQ